jgi:3,4-dihydroxy 2-butanone 4-phosphate synthase/GTP cyclohydrolase II
MKDDSQLHSIEEAIAAIGRGEAIIVVDDEDRENEGDFVAAARFATPELINFMATEGRGLICAPLVEDRCDQLGLELMVARNSAAFETPFTVSVDLIGNGCTTGISASDRSKTMQALIDPGTDPAALGRPGHIFPLRARRGGVLRRAGHTEAAIDFARLAGLEPAGVIVEIMNPDGSMARLPDLLKIAEKHKLPIVSIADLISYRLAHDTIIERTAEADVDVDGHGFKLISYRQTTDECEHIAMVLGEWDAEDIVPVRVHNSPAVLDQFGVSGLGKGEELRDALKRIIEKGAGAVVCIRPNAPERSAAEAIARHASGLRTTGAAGPALDTGASEEAPMERARQDDKEYGVGAQILRNLGIRRLALLSDRVRIRKGMTMYGLEIVDVIPLH